VLCSFLEKAFAGGLEASEKRDKNAGVAQLVERNLAKVEVESSRLFSRSIFGS
jgi:hypothetical protein